MDENFENRPENNQVNNEDNIPDPENNKRNIEENSPTNNPVNNVINLPGNDYEIKRFSMDDKGDIRVKGGSAAVAAGTSRLFIVLGWISAALALLISPLFAIAGIVFGVLVNRQSKGKGNAIIITNVVVAVLGMIIGAIGTMLRF